MTKDEAFLMAIEALDNADYHRADEAITAIKAALEAKDEPVGWIDSKGNMICTKINESCKPLYTTPPQRTWVGLTYEDMVGLQKELFDKHGEMVLPTTLAMAVEAKLKEKNR